MNAEKYILRLWNKNMCTYSRTLMCAHAEVINIHTRARMPRRKANQLMLGLGLAAVICLRSGCRGAFDRNPYNGASNACVLT